MTIRGSVIAGLIGIVLAANTTAGAQPATKGEQPSGAMQGLQLNRDQPVKIEANSLEVRDKQRQATFIGKVKLTQGDTILHCDSLVIFYDDNSTPPPAAQKKGAPPAATAGAGPLGGNQQIKRAEAKGNVLVTQKDQTAKGDNGVFDTKANNITLTGNVVVTQGTNVLRGTRMVVNLTTGVTNVESNQGQRVEGLFNPSAAPAPTAAAAPAPTPPPAPSKAQPAPPPGKQSPAAKSQPGAPTRIN